MSGIDLTRRQVRELLSPLVGDPEVSMEVGGAAALALGLVFISSQDEDCVGAALQARHLVLPLARAHCYILTLEHPRTAAEQLANAYGFVRSC